MNTNSSRQVVAATALLLMCVCLPPSVAAHSVNEPICDAAADHLLAADNYPESIWTSSFVPAETSGKCVGLLSSGFAEGMTGDKTGELRESLENTGAPLHSDYRLGTYF